MFKFVVLCALVAAASGLSTFGAAKHGSQSSYGGGHSSGHSSASSDDVHAEVTNYSSDVRPDGFQYAYDTTNSIHDAAAGNAYGDIQGDFGWTSPEGVHVAIQYVADENGYQPSGDLLPTPPPIPAAILKALEYIRTHPPPQQEYRSAATTSHGNNNYGRHF